MLSMEKGTVRKILLMVALTLTLATIFLGAPKRNFQTGKLVDVTEDESVKKGTSYRWPIFTVQIGDLVYTAQGERIHRSGDLGQGLIVGDTVQVALDAKEDLILLKPGGKEIKAKIIKRARAQ